MMRLPPQIPPHLQKGPARNVFPKWLLDLRCTHRLQLSLSNLYSSTSIDFTHHYFQTQNDSVGSFATEASSSHNVEELDHVTQVCISGNRSVFSSMGSLIPRRLTRRSRSLCVVAASDPGMRIGVRVQEAIIEAPGGDAEGTLPSPSCSTAHGTSHECSRGEPPVATVSADSLPGSYWTAKARAFTRKFRRKKQQR